MPTFEERLVDKFPEFDNSWSDADKLCWFEQFSYLMNSLLRREPEAISSNAKQYPADNRGYTKLI